LANQRCLDHNTAVRWVEYDAIKGLTIMLLDTVQSTDFPKDEQ
jgi:hypothetical protein